MATSRPSDGSPLPFEVDTSADGPQPWQDSASVLPVRCRPQPEELLSSWLVRLAWLNAEKLHTFRRRFWLHPGSPWGCNIDLSLPYDALGRIARMTLAPPDSLVNQTLAQYCGKLFEVIEPQGSAHGILANRHRGRQLLGYGLQLCPDCIRSGAVAYFRRSWKISYVVVCPIHNRLLIDACPGCKQPLAYHQADLGRALLPERVPTAFCGLCGYSWAEEIPNQESPIPGPFAEWQGQIPS